MRFTLPLPVLAASLTAVLVLVNTGCTGSPTAIPDSEPAFSAVNADGSVNRPFKAMMTTSSLGAVPDPVACPGATVLREHQAGGGEATALGRFTVDFTFCIDIADLLDDGQLTAGESIPYWDGVGTFVAANGDELIMSISGEIIPSSRPGFNSEFHDAFDFVGGTGRFAGASGNGVTDSYVQQSPNWVLHDMGGTLTFHPGN